MYNSQLLIHIGYPKTASTWLQEVIFKNEKSGFIAPWGAQSAEAIEQFIIANSFLFSAKSAYEVFEPGLKEATKRAMIPVISHESLTGTQIKGTYRGKQVADRIYAVFPQAKILLFIREQKSIVLSSYREHIKKGVTVTLERFIGAGKRIPGFAPTCQLDHLQYDLIVSYYQNLFGEKNVLVIPFELLKNSPINVTQKILNFVDLNENIEHLDLKALKKRKNVGFKGATVSFRRQLNKFSEPAYFGQGGPPLSWRVAQKLSKTVDLFFPKTIHQRFEKRYRKIIAEHIKDYFYQSNKRTSQLIELDLENLGYDC